MNKTILITGGTGSFGSAYIKHLVKLKEHSKIICFSRCWLKQKTLRDELGNPECMRWFIGDIRDKDRLCRALKGVDTVVHAAAIKDLESCEYNPSEAMLTNIVGTQNLVDVCIENGVGKCILISTDKAVSPCNTYGTSKAMAEKLWINANKYAADDNIKFSICRYGNVVGSNGSIVPVWRKMIEQGCVYLPITHHDMTRFWLKMEEAIELVNNSLEFMSGGEVFTPELPSVRITDLAEAFNMPYKIVGIREGEKIHETLGQYDEARNLIDSGNNPWFLTVAEIKETIKEELIKHE